MINCIAKIDPFSENNFIDKKLVSKDGFFDVSIQAKRIKIPFKTKDLKLKDFEVII